MGIKNKDIKLCSLLKEKYIELNLTGRDKEEIITELVNLISKSGKIRNKKAFLKALIEREKLGSTAIGNGVAIPHAKIKGRGKLTLAFGRSSEGVDFNSLDGEKTYIFFMLVSLSKDIGAHLKILAKISHLIRNKFIVGLLKEAENKKEVLKIISDLEKNNPIY